jgi:hypothetical protein
MSQTTTCSVGQSTTWPRTVVNEHGSASVKRVTSGWIGESPMATHARVRAGAKTADDYNTL